MKKYSIILLSLIFSVILHSCSDDDNDTDLGEIPEATFTTDKENYIIGETVYLFDNTPDDGNIASYYWHFGFDGVGSNSTDKNTSVTYPRAGTYIVKLTVTNNQGGYKTSEKEIVIDRVNEAPSADFTSSPTVSVIGSPVSFTDTSEDDGDIESWFWEFGDGATSSEQNPTHTYSQGGFIKVKLTVTDDRGLTASREKTLLVRTSLTPGVLEILWTQTFEASSTLRSVSPAVGDNGDIYVASNGLKLYSYAPDGTQNWMFDLTKGGSVGNQESSPAVDTDGTIYIGVGQGSSSSNTYLYAINPDGTEKWEYLIGVGSRVAYTSPVITADGYIAIGNRGSGGAVKVVDRNKTQQWSTSPTGGVGGGMAADRSGNVYAGSTGSNGFSISKEGTVSTTFLGAGYNANGTYPAIDESGNVYLAMNNAGVGTLVSFSPQGTKNWEFATAGSASQGGPAIGTDGTIYIGTTGGKLYAVTRGGSQRWSYTNPYDITCVPAVDSDGYIHFTDEGGYYTILDASGTMKQQVKLGTKIWSSPVISDYGIIYITVEDGGACKLVAVDFGIQGPANSPWAQMGQNARRTFLQK